MEIKVGEYGRNNKGNIFIYANVLNENGEKLDYIIKFINGGPIKYRLGKDEQIVKHSFNLIDLIEVGDYVNGYKAISIDKDAPENCIELDRNNAYEYQFISSKDIKSILTHQQFEANCYKTDTKQQT